MALVERLWVAVLIYSALVCAIFTIVYGLKAKWWRSFLGINLFMEAVAVTVFFVLAAIDSLFGIAWEWAARSVLIVVSVVMTQRLAILFWIRRGRGPLIGYLMGRRRAGSAGTGAAVDSSGGTGGG